MDPVQAQRSYSPREAAQILFGSNNAEGIRELCRSNRLGHFKRGAHFRIPARAINDSQEAACEAVRRQLEGSGRGSA